MVKVRNMTSKNTGKKVVNQFIIAEEGRGANGNFIKKEVFQSYNYIIAEVITWEDRVNVSLDKIYWDYCKNTEKYRNQFLGETKKETVAKIKSGEYKLENLNN